MAVQIVAANNSGIGDLDRQIAPAAFDSEPAFNWARRTIRHGTQKVRFIDCCRSSRRH